MWSKESATSNGFSRTFVYPQIKLNKIVELPSSAFVITGKLDKDIMLKDFKKPTSIFLFSKATGRLKSILPYIPVDFKSNYINHSYLAPYLFISNTKGVISRLNTKSKNSDSFKYKTKFDQAVALSNQSFIIRSKKYQYNSKERFLEKLTLLKDTITMQYKFAKPAAEIFDTDGLLHYDQESSKVIYMFFYRGEFLCLDTNLNVMYKAKTIDTVRTADIKVSKLVTKLKDGGIIKSSKQTNLNSIVNQHITTHNGFVYILSRLKADNEKDNSINKSRVIDVYALANGKYIHSFYLSNYRSHRLLSFFVESKSITAIFDNYLIVYDVY